MGGRRLLPLIAAFGLVVALALYLVRSLSPSTPSAEPAAAPSAPLRSSLSPPSTSGRDSAGVRFGRQVAEGEREPRRARTGDSLDPCAPLVLQPGLPEGYKTLTAEGITIAWDPAIALEPTALAYLSAGLLAEIGAVTGTQPRDQLVIVVYPSLDEFRTRTAAPAWSDGVYDGAVRAPAAHTDIGVEMHTLRHELVHAQIHAAVGCTPVWLDEGLAQYFANTVPLADWQQMLAGKHALPLASLQARNLDDIPGETSTVYAQSLAMVLYVLARGDTIADVIHDRRGSPYELWSRRYGGASEHDVLDAIARRMFAMPLGLELDALLAGHVCCRGTSRLPDLACHAPPRQKGELCFAPR